jgi:hypothetical protein
VIPEKLVRVIAKVIILYYEITAIAPVSGGFASPFSSVKNQRSLDNSAHAPRLESGKIMSYPKRKVI